MLSVDFACQHILRACNRHSAEGSGRAQSLSDTGGPPHCRIAQRMQHSHTKHDCRIGSASSPPNAGRAVDPAVPEWERLRTTRSRPFDAKLFNTPPYSEHNGCALLIKYGFGAAIRKVLGQFIRFVARHPACSTECKQQKRLQKRIAVHHLQSCCRVSALLVIPQRNCTSATACYSQAL